MRQLIIIIALTTVGFVGLGYAQDEEAPDGVKMLLPRGGIPAVFEPTFVSADSAEISDDAWILGIELNGEAHAYSLNLLNHHEIVNDYVGDMPVAAVW
jgi:hypothetical protein